jgi:hypothetical protein
MDTNTENYNDILDQIAGHRAIDQIRTLLDYLLRKVCDEHKVTIDVLCELYNHLIDIDCELSKHFEA